MTDKLTQRKENHPAETRRRYLTDAELEAFTAAVEAESMLRAPAAVQREVSAAIRKKENRIRKALGIYAAEVGVAAAAAVLLLMPQMERAGNQLDKIQRVRLESSLWDISGSGNRFLSDVNTLMNELVSGP